MKPRIAVLLVLGISHWAGLHAQQTPTTTFRVSASVQAVCEVTATDVDLGAYSAQAGSPLQGATLLRATCTPDSSYNIRLNDAQRSAIWGNTTGTDTVTGVGTGLLQDHTVFGAVPAAQVIPAGGHVDATTVRIYY